MVMFFRPGMFSNECDLPGLLRGKITFCLISHVLEYEQEDHHRDRRNRSRDKREALSADFSSSSRLVNDSTRRMQIILCFAFNRSPLLSL